MKKEWDDMQEWESTDRILTNNGKYNAVFSEKAVYAVPIGESAPQGSFCAGRCEGHEQLIDGRSC